MQFSSLPQSSAAIHRNLHGNKIQRLPYGLFDNMKSLRMLRLDSNLLECDCSVMWLVKHIQETKNHLNASATCKSPRIMEGKNLLDMTEDELHCSEFNFKMTLKFWEINLSLSSFREASNFTKSHWHRSYVWIKCCLHM